MISFRYRTAILCTQLMLMLVVGLNGQDGLMTFGGTQNETGFAVAVTPDDGYLLAGSTRSYGAGSWDAFVVKLDGAGITKWIETYGWKHHDHLKDVVVLPDGYLFVGHVWDFGPARQDIYLLKTDLSGARVFDNILGTHLKDMGFCVKPVSDGGYLVIGYSRGYEPHGDILVLKIDNEGNEVWRNNFGTVYDDYAYDFQELEDGSFLIFGSEGSFHQDVHYNYKKADADWLLIQIDSQGNETWRKTYAYPGHDFARSIAKAEDGGYYLFGSTMGSGAGSFDMLLVKVDESGEETWSKTYGGSDYEYGMSMTQNSAGDLYLFGSSKSFGEDGTPDYYLVQTSPLGEEQWTLTVGGGDLEYGYSVVATADDGCAIIGQSRSNGAGEFDMMLVKVRENGTIENIIDGVDTSNQDQIVLFPNPARDRVQFQPPLTGDDYQMELIASNGTSIATYAIKFPQYSFDVGDLPAGLYTYRITISGQNNKVVSGKLVIQ